MSKQSKELKNKHNKTRQSFLLTFFSPEPHYQTQEVNGFMLVKQYNGGTGEWDVAIYTQKSWDKVLEWKQSREVPVPNRPIPEQTVIE